MLDVYSFMKTVLKYDSELTIIEVGAADGNDSLKLLDIFKNSKLYCLEPDPRGYELHKKYINNKNCKLYNLAISDIDGEVELKLSNKDPKDPKLNHKAQKKWYDGNITKYEVYEEASKIFSDKFDIKHTNDSRYGWLYSSTISEVNSNINLWSHKIHVKTLKLDTFCFQNNITKIDFLWTDVEGAEKKLIDGAKNILKFTKYIMLEFGCLDYYKSSLNYHQTKDLMKKYNFTECFISQDNSNIIFKNNLLTL